MPFEYNDIHSDFIHLNATQSIHLAASNIFINDVNITTSLKQLSHTPDTDNTPNIIPRIDQLETNTNNLISNYSNLQQNVSTHISSYNTVLNNIKESILSHKSIIDSNLEKNVLDYTNLDAKINTLESVSNQLSENMKGYTETVDTINKKLKYIDSNLEKNVLDYTNLDTKINTLESVLNRLVENMKGYTETIDTINKKLKYTESNQIDIMSIMTRVITLENANREVVDTNESLRKTILDNNNKIQELSCKLNEANTKLPEPVINNDLRTNDDNQSAFEKPIEQHEKVAQISRAKSIVGRKK